MKLLVAAALLAVLKFVAPQKSALTGSREERIKQLETQVAAMQRRIVELEKRSVPRVIALPSDRGRHRATRRLRR